MMLIMLMIDDILVNMDYLMMVMVVRCEHMTASKPPNKKGSAPSGNLPGTLLLSYKIPASTGPSTRAHD